MLIGISGYIGSGKDTVANILIDIFNQHNKQIQVVRFADKLKDILCLLTGCTREQLEDREFKESSMPEEWTHVGYDSKWNEYYDIKPMTYRKALQYIGTDLFRNQFHENTWVNATMVNYKAINGWREEHYQGESILSGMLRAKESWPNWIMPDVRFPNEAQAILDAGGMLIRIHRPNKTGIEQVLHESESALDSFHGFHINILNDGTVPELKDKIEHIAHQFKLTDYADTNNPIH